jgi:transcriptional regulator with XRE-family HTH domain
LHRNYVGAIERGEINPTFLTLLRLTSGIEIPLSGRSGGEAGPRHGRSRRCATSGIERQGDRPS